MSKPKTTILMRALVSALVASLPAALLAAELPPDRESLSIPAEQTEKNAPLILPNLSDDAFESTDRGWATTDAEMLLREAHLRRVSAAFGLAGSLTGTSVTCLLVAAGQTDPSVRRGWHYAAITTGSVAGLALITGTVLWATTPSAPGRPRLALGQGPTVGLALTFF